MKSLQTHFTLIFALVCLLSSFQLYSTIDSLSKVYEQNLNNEYSIIAVSSQKLDESVFKKRLFIIKQVEQLDAMPHLGYLKEGLSPENFSLLKESLPYFYKIKLSRYPSNEELAKAEKALKSIDGISKVETFAKSQNNIFRLLQTVQTLTSIYFAIIFVINMMLFIKFMELWRYQHSDRIYIMSIHGAPIWMRSIVLFKTAVFDGIVSLALVLALFYYISVEPKVSAYLAWLGVASSFPFDPVQSLTQLSIIVAAVCFTSVLLVMFKGVKEH